jgi:hypothetical protein
MRPSRNRINIEGLYFGNLKVLFYYDTRRTHKTSRARWLCECVCGRFLVAEGRKLKSGSVMSCGCLLPKTQKHGMTGTRIYNTWKNVRYKCQVCDEWQDFKVFCLWSMSNGYRDGLFLKRIDEQGIFCPCNCTWEHPKNKHNKHCEVCHKPISPKNDKFCSLKCQKVHQYQRNIKEWKEGRHDGISGRHYVAGFIKKYLRKKYHNSCALCGWNQINVFTNNIPLEVEHVDGNYLNNTESNLLLLCPNCHSLTSTYKGANRGNGRKYRSKYRLQ